MRRRRRDFVTLHCFSPPVMLVTFVVELGLAAYVFATKCMTRFARFGALALVLAAIFQFAEYQVCTTTGPGQVLWSRVGFASITLLPIVGLYLVSLVSHSPHFLKLGYISATAFVVYFALVPKSVTTAICGGNYVIFNGSNDFFLLYGIYYWGFLLLGIWESIEKISSLGRRSPTRNLLRWMIVMYLSFMAPMGIVYVVFPITRSAVASIMCGFAILMALILTFKIIPAYNRTHAT